MKQLISILAIYIISVSELVTSTTVRTGEVGQQTANDTTTIQETTSIAKASKHNICKHNVIQPMQAKSSSTISYYTAAQAQNTNTTSQNHITIAEMKQRVADAENKLKSLQKSYEDALKNRRWAEERYASLKREMIEEYANKTEELNEEEKICCDSSGSSIAVTVKGAIRHNIQSGTTHCAQVNETHDALRTERNKAFRKLVMEWIPRIQTAGDIDTHLAASHLKSERNLLEAIENGAVQSTVQELESRSEYAIRLWNNRARTVQLRTEIEWRKVLKFLEYLDTHPECSWDVFADWESFESN